MLKVGVIGAGNRIIEFIKKLSDYDMGVVVSAITDIDTETVKKRLGETSINSEYIKFYTDADEMLEQEQFDGVIIGTNCSSHTFYATKVLKLNISIFLEKPVAINMEQLLELREAYNNSDSEVVVSFPLRATPIVQFAKKIIESGQLGRIEHVQAINNVPYGRAYFHEWYRNENETGGLFLQKATHDLDYINYLLDTEPVMICAMKSKQIFKGDKPAGLKCIDCEEYETCPESPFILKHFKNERVRGEHCCFGVDTGNEDSGSVLVKYESGMHVTYSQNFFARKKAAARGARLFGYNGTLEFDWYKDELKVMMHDMDREEIYKFDTLKINHFGGDEMLAYNFIRVMQKKEKSASPMEAGLMSALMCLKANESSSTNSFMEIKF